MEEKEFLELTAKTYNDEQGNLDLVDCPTCKNKGYIMKVVYSDFYKHYQQVVVECECKEQRKALLQAKYSGLGDYLNKTIDDFKTCEIWQKNIKLKAIDYCSSENNEWFIICGQSGCGKTLICSIISNYLLHRKRQVKYITWTDFISKLKRDMMGDNSNQVSAYLEETKTVEVLYIDELLKKYNDTDLKYIIEIINYRYTNNLKTIISSERTIDDLIDIDEATFSRVIEKADKYVINIPKDKKKNYRLRNLY